MEAKLQLDKLIERSESTGSSNYLSWRFKLNLILKTKALFDVATGVTVRPFNNEDTLSAWEKKDLEAQTIIGINVDENIALKLRVCTSAAQMIERLETLYGKKSQSTQDGLRMQFFGYKYEDSKTPVENCLAIDGLAQELRALGEEIKDEWIIARILNCLPERFKHFYSAWDSTASTEKTLSKLMERLQQEEQRMQSCDQANTENALFSKGKQKFNKKFQGQSKSSNENANNKQSNNQQSGNKNKCYKCGKNGHVKSQCHGKPCQEYIDYCKRHYKCNNCQETGHFAKECPRKEGTAKLFLSVTLSAAEVSNISNDSESWYQDSGATHHMTGNLKWISNLTAIQNPVQVKLGDASILKCHSMGNVHMTAYDGKTWYPIVLERVLYVPEMTFNLFSLTTALDKGYKQEADANRSVILENNNPVLIGERIGGLFRMKFNKVNEHCLSAISIKVWHERLAHQNVAYVRGILNKNNIKYIDDWEGYVCEGCAYGKQCRVSHKANPTVAEQCLDVIHVDLGEMNERSLGGSKYFLLLKDDYSHFRTIYFLKTKSEAVDKLKIFLNLVKNQFGRQVKILKSDNGTEIKNEKSKNLFEELGIFHLRSATYTPEQNGRIEREMRTIVEAARAEMYAEKLSVKLWAEALNYSVFTINQTGTSSVKGKSPAELWFGRHVNLKSMKPFGCECYVLSPEHERKKLDKKSTKGILIGYDLEEQGYRIYVPNENRIVISCNVIFKENLSVNNNSVNINLDSDKVEDEERSKEKRSIERQEESEEESQDDADLQSLEDEQEKEEEPIENHENLSDEAEEPSEETPQPNLRNKRLIKPHPKYNDYYTNFLALTGDVEDMSTEEALSDAQWKCAMDDEIKSIKQFNTWILVDPPPDRKVLSCRWVLRIKGNGRKKARLVARGNKQEYGVDYFKTFSPVARHASIRLLLSHAAKENLHVKTFDIKTAFLNGDLQEDIYMSQPEGYQDGSNKVCKLLKSIYGLKQAPKAWNAKLTGFLEGLGFESTDDDPCLFYNNSCTIILAIFVDDGLVIGKCKTKIENVLSNLAKKFEVTSDNPSQGKIYYLGMKIDLKKNGIFLNQAKYTQNMLNQYGFSDAYAVSTPMEPGMLSDNSTNEAQLTNKPCREAVGSLLYLSTISRPDISFAVNFVSRHVSNPKQNHWKIIERIFRYLKGTFEYGIFFTGNNKLKVFTDSNYGGDGTDLNSTSGILIENGGPLVWIVQKQKQVAISSAEAEYRAAVTGISEVCWIRRIIGELKLQDVSSPTDLLIDNQAALHMLENADEGKITKGKKHIEIKRKFISQHIGVTVNPVYIRSKDQVADIFTKPLSKGPFLYLRRKLLKEECWVSNATQ